MESNHNYTYQALSDFAEAVLGKPDFQAVAEAIREKRIVENGPSTIALKVNE